jgi:hypothetical protein
LFLATPAFVVNGNSLESDIPFLAFWMAGVATFVRAVDQRGRADQDRRFQASYAIWLTLSAVSCALAAMTAFQAVFIVPILALHLWRERRNWYVAWVAILAAPAVLGAWQLWERAASGELPATVLTGYLQTYGLQTLAKKARNAIALTAHLGWMAVPPSALIPLWAVPFAAGGSALFWCIRKWRDWLAQWILIFFAGALAVFFAGSARYLLPIAAPVALLLSRLLPRPTLIGCFALQLSIGLALAFVNYQHWDGYRRIASALPAEHEQKRVWINGEWGLRFYTESRGALPMVLGQAVQPGETVVLSELGFPVAFNTGGGVLVAAAEHEIRPFLPFRLIGLNSKSAYSTADRGFQPFGISIAPVDRVRIGTVVALEPTHQYLTMASEAAAAHIVSGVYQLEGRARWTGRRALFLLRRPTGPSRLKAVVYMPDAAPGKRLTFTAGGRDLGSSPLSAGSHTLTSGVLPPGQGGSITAGIEVDRTLQLHGDARELGVVLVEIGFVEP